MKNCVNECEVTRSKPFAIFSTTRIWKQFAGTHSGRRITVRDDSVHKVLRRRIVRAPSISWNEILNQT